MLVFGLTVIAAAMTFSAAAESYIIVGKNAKVFDGPNSDYVTLNQKNPVKRHRRWRQRP